MAVVREGDPFLVALRLSEGNRSPVFLAEEIGQFPRDEVVVGLADYLWLRRAEEALEGRVAGEVDALRVLEPNEVGNGLQKGR